jgi:hypothetical protein
MKRIQACCLHLLTGPADAEEVSLEQQAIPRNRFSTGLWTTMTVRRLGVALREEGR